MQLAITESNPARVSTLFLMDKVFAGPFMFKHCLKLCKTGKVSAPKMLSKRRKWPKIPQTIKGQIIKATYAIYPHRPEFPQFTSYFWKKLWPIAAIKQKIALYSGNKRNASQKSLKAKNCWRSSSSCTRSASNSNQDSHNTQTLPTLTHTLSPYSIAGFLQSSFGSRILMLLEHRECSVYSVENPDWQFDIFGNLALFWSVQHFWILVALSTYLWWQNVSRMHLVGIYTGNGKSSESKKVPKTRHSNAHTTALV